MISGIVGIDPSFTSLGIARQPFVLDNQCFLWRTFTSSVNDGSRLNRILALWKKCQGVIQKDDVVFIEDYAYSAGKRARSAQSLAQLGELCGILNLFISRYTGREAIKVTPGQWKKFLCGMGNLNKDSFKLKVFRKFDIETDSNDASVAVALCDLGAHVCTGREHWRELTKYEHDVLDKFTHTDQIELVRMEVDGVG